MRSDSSQDSGIPAALDVIASPSLRHTRPEIFPSNVSCMHPPAVDSTSPMRAKVPVAVATVAAISATNDPCNSPAKYISVSWTVLGLGVYTSSIDRALGPCTCVNYKVAVGK